MRFAADGMVDLAIGTQSNGQGHETSFPQFAAQWLGLPEARFRLVQADTDAVPFGNGHGGARSLHVGGTALVMAMEAVLEKARRLAAHLLQAAPEALDFAAGAFRVRGSERGIDLPALAVAARDPAQLPEGMAPGLDAEAKNLSDAVAFPSGAHLAEVEIDPETGTVALLRGGLAQGIGQALLERILHAPETGQLLTASPMDYALPRADDLPPLEIELREDPTGVNPLGVKGVGQAGAIGAPQTVMAAVRDALGGVDLAMPATPEAVWRALRGR